MLLAEWPAVVVPGLDFRVDCKHEAVQTGLNKKDQRTEVWLEDDGLLKRRDLQ